MKMGILLGIAALIGVVGGVGSTYFTNVNRGPEVFRPVRKVFRDVDPNRMGPRVEVDQATFDFGTMPRYGTMSHTFKITNVGTELLTLSLIRTTCKCTLSEVKEESVEPGKSTEITLEWTAKDIGDVTTFGQTAEFETNDTDIPMLELRVRGEITDGVRAVPDTIVVRDIPADEDHTTTYRVYSFGDEPLRVVNEEWVQKEFVDHFEMTWRRMTESEYSERIGANDGIVGTVVLKTGLPLGPIRQTIRLTLNQGDRHIVDIPIRGNIASDILVSGRSYEPQRSILNLGNVASRAGIEHSLFFFVKGPHRDSTKFEVTEIKPAEGLECTIGEAKPIAGGRTIQYKVTIRVPPGTPPGSYLGTKLSDLATIRISTTHPSTKEVPIYVRYAVKP